MVLKAVVSLTTYANKKNNIWITVDAIFSAVSFNFEPDEACSTNSSCTLRCDIYVLFSRFSRNCKASGLLKVQKVFNLRIPTMLFTFTWSTHLKIHGAVQKLVWKQVLSPLGNGNRVFLLSPIQYSRFISKHSCAGVKTTGTGFRVLKSWVHVLWQVATNISCCHLVSGSEDRINIDRIFGVNMGGVVCTLIHPK